MDPRVLMIVMSCLALPVGAIRWKDCGSTEAKVITTFVEGCEKQDTCIIHKGTNTTFGIDFQPSVNNDNLKMLVYGHIAGIDVPFPIDNPQACKNSNITCPVVKDKTYSYRNVIFVKTEYPSISLIVKLKLVNQANDVLACVVIPVKIDSGSNSNSALRFIPKL